MALQYRDFDQSALADFKHYQQQAYHTLLAVESQLTEGMTEIEAARMLRKSFHEQGVHSYFHVPVVLFGERTAYPGKFGQFEALATDKVLEPNMPVILDAAPIYQGYIVDTSWSTVYGENALHRKLHDELPKFRTELLAQVKQGNNFRDIAQHTDQMIQDLGAENCHKKHIGEVLGHRVFRASNFPWNRISIKQLSVRHVAWLFWKSYAAVKGWQDESPNWNHRRTSNHPPHPGLWAVEPHFAVDGVGVKFEEIMVITEDDAFWLDDNPPHVQQWMSTDAKN